MVMSLQILLKSFGVCEKMLRSSCYEEAVHHIKAKLPLSDPVLIHAKFVDVGQKQNVDVEYFSDRSRIRSTGEGQNLRCGRGLYGAEDGRPVVCHKLNKQLP